MRFALALVVLVSACGCPPRPPRGGSAIPPTHLMVLPAAAPQEPRWLVRERRAPMARVVDVVDRDYGLELSDPYRWMEGVENPEHAAWLRAQGEYAHHVLQQLPGRDKLHARLRELGFGVSAVFDVQRAGDRLFHRVFPADAQLAKLAVLEPDYASRILVDPERLADGASHASLEAYSVSPDGSLVAYVVARGGSERGQLRVMDVATGRDLPEVIDRIWGEGAASWLPDGKSFFYTQLVADGGGDPMANQITRLHVVGTPVEQDVTILGRDPGATWVLAPEEWPGLWIPPGSRWAIAYAGGARRELRIGVAKVTDLDRTGAGKTPWRTVATYNDDVEAAIPHGDRLYLLTGRDAPNRRVVSVPLAAPVLAKARVEIPEDPNATLTSMYAARDALYIVHLVEGLARVSRWPWRGTATPLALPYTGWVPDLATDPQQDGIVFQIESWLRPGTYFRYLPAAKQLVPAALASTTNADVSELIAEEVEATSADGTRVPLSIIRRKDLALDGTHPTIVAGYAAYGVSQTPGFSSSRVAWVERGGVYAICHGRGGGEKGRRWQEAGSREHKMVGVHDFIACAEYLVAKRYTSPARLAAYGASMGGLLVGRALTERPELFAAAHLGAPLVNPTRILYAINGANQKGELGDPGTEAGFRSLAEMDPYHHVKAGTAYPAVILTVGANDQRVAPWMASKLAARLAASSTSKRPILLRVEGDAGHGIGSTRDQSIAERADVWSFFLSVFATPI